MLESVSPLDIIFSMQFGLLLSNKANFLSLFFLPILFKNILTIAFLIRNTRPILTLTITADVPMTVINEYREVLLLTPQKTSKVLST